MVIFKCVDEAGPEPARLVLVEKTHPPGGHGSQVLEPRLGPEPTGRAFEARLGLGHDHDDIRVLMEDFLPAEEDPLFGLMQISNMSFHYSYNLFFCNII